MSDSALTSIPRKRPNSPTLMGCPVEIRQIIFKHLFGSTRLTFGYRTIQYQYRKVVPARNELAILLVNRQIYQETAGLWMSRVLFNFEDGMTLLDKLSSIPQATLRKIRQLRTRMIHSEPQAPAEIPRQFVHDLHLLPGLSLDQLQIVSPWGFDRNEYFGCPDLELFFRAGFPSKKLCLITPGSPFHQTEAWTSGEVSGALSAKINSWAVDLEHWQSDDAAPQLTISVIQSTELDSEHTGTVFNDSARLVLDTTAVSADAIKDKLVEFGNKLHPEAETMVIFKKPSATPAANDDAERTWQGDVRNEYLLNREMDDLENMTTGDLFPWPHKMRPAYIIPDRYNNVDDIIWPGKNHDQAWEGALEDF